MIAGLSLSASAATTLDENGEQGAFASPDAVVNQDKVLILEKELRAYNKDGNTVWAPAISYTYTVTAGSAGKSVTDNADKHDPSGSVTAPTKAGIVNGVSVTGTAANVIEFTNADELATDSDGRKNVKDLSISFENVVFTGSGVYRYKISEQLTSGAAYADSGVTETTGNHDRYIDVYVRPNDTDFQTVRMPRTGRFTVIPASTMTQISPTLTRPPQPSRQPASWTAPATAPLRSWLTSITPTT